MSTISAAAITDAGYAALVQAMANGTKVFPKTARVSATAHTIDREVTALVDYWWEGDITLVNVIDVNTYEARVIIPPDLAADYMRAVGLYLEDGALFAISAAKDLPPGAGQEIIIQLSYSDIVALTDFQYLSYDAWEDHLEILDLFSQLSQSILENAEAIGLLENRIPGYSDVDQAISNLTGQVAEHTLEIVAIGDQADQTSADLTALTGRVTAKEQDLTDLEGRWPPMKPILTHCKAH